MKTTESPRSPLQPPRLRVSLVSPIHLQSHEPPGLSGKRHRVAHRDLPITPFIQLAQYRGPSKLQ